MHAPLLSSLSLYLVWSIPPILNLLHKPTPYTTSLITRINMRLLCHLQRLVTLPCGVLRRQNIGFWHVHPRWWRIDPRSKRWCTYVQRRVVSARDPWSGRGRRWIGHGDILGRGRTHVWWEARDADAFGDVVVGCWYYL